MVQVSVVVLNYNGAEMLAEALPSLTRQTCDSMEILVADNGSMDLSERVASEFGAKFVALGINHGFALGNNLASAHAKGEYMFFVNNDMRFTRECVESLAETLAEFQRVFAADCLQYGWGTRRIAHEGTIIRPGTWRSRPLLFLEVNPVGFNDQTVLS